MKKSLHVKFSETRDRRPLAVVDGFPGSGAELMVDQLRALADTLNRIADCLVLYQAGKIYSAHNEFFIVSTEGAE